MTDEALKATRWQKFLHSFPFNRELGISPQAMNADWCTLKLEYKDTLVGDPRSGTLHGGVITSLLDVVLGFAVLLRLPESRHIVTLNLRIDQLQPTTPGRLLLGGAVCYKLTPEFAFARGCAYHESVADPVATAMGIYMLTTGTPVIRE